MQLWLIRHPKGSKVLFGKRRLLNLIIFIPVLLPMIFSNAKSVAAQQINNAVWRAALKDDGKTNQNHVEGQLMTSENIKLIKQPCHSKKKKSHIFSAAPSRSPGWAWPGSQQMPQNLDKSHPYQRDALILLSIRSRMSLVQNKTKYSTDVMSTQLKL